MKEDEFGFEMTADDWKQVKDNIRAEIKSKLINLQIDKKAYEYAKEKEAECSKNSETD